MSFSSPKLIPYPDIVGRQELFKTSYKVSDLVGTEEWRLKHAGPTDVSHWLIPGSVLVSQCPDREKDEVKLKGLLTKYLDSGMTFFVSLRSKQEYSKVVEDLGESNCGFMLNPLPYKGSAFSFNLPRNQVFIRGVRRIVDEIMKNLEKGRKVLLHCYDGRDRSAVVGAELLRRLYPEISMEECFRWIQATFSCRRTFPDRYPHQASPRSDEYRYLISLLFSQRE